MVEYVKRRMQIWKFPLTMEDVTDLSIPQGSEILCVQTQNNKPCIWAKVWPDNPLEKRRFLIVGTAHPINYEHIEYVDTVQMYSGNLVFHIFEIIRGGRLT